MNTFRIKIDSRFLEKQNKAFHRMSKKRQRLAIAADVLAQIKAHRYVAEEGTYIAFDIAEEGTSKAIYDGLDEKTPKSFQELLVKNKDIQCYVCGIGAAVCSLARLGDQVEENVDKYHSYLIPIFGERQVAMIEHAFEGSNIGFPQTRISLSEKDQLACEKFFDRFDNEPLVEDRATKRLAAIFRNIIRNDGVFKP